MGSSATIGLAPFLLLVAVLVELLCVIFSYKFIGFHFFIFCEFLFMFGLVTSWKMTGLGTGFGVLAFIVVSILYFLMAFPTFPPEMKGFMKGMPRRLFRRRLFLLT